MFTTGTAVDSFRNILSASVAALAQEVAYAENQCIRMEGALMPYQPSEFRSAETEFEMATNDAIIFEKAAYVAFSGLVQLSAVSPYDAEQADSLRALSEARQHLAVEQYEIAAVRDREYI